MVLGGGDTLADHPEVAREFDYERNGDLRPEDIPAARDIKVFWVCANDPEHRWQASVKTRVQVLTGCAEDELNAADELIEPDLPTPVEPLAVEPAGAALDELWQELFGEVGRQLVGG